MGYLARWATAGSAALAGGEGASFEEVKLPTDYTVQLVETSVWEGGFAVGRSGAWLGLGLGLG